MSRAVNEVVPEGRIDASIPKLRHANPVASEQRNLFALICLIFFVSGFSALLYQVAWQRLLTVHYGVGAVSVTLIVSVYMLGLGVGALVGGILTERVRDRVTVYFVVELLIGLFGLISLPFLDYLGRTTAGASYVVAFGCMFLFLSVPTLLMGMTLPLLTKILNHLIQDFFHTVSTLYFVNTLGAAAGAFTATYVLISYFGLDTAVYVAVVLNLVLAAIIFQLRRHIPKDAPVQRQPRLEGHALPAFAVPLLVLVTGFLAIGYEIIWFRLFEVLVKASPYAFSTVLTIYLIGIGLGSWGMDRIVRRKPDLNKATIFFSLQFFIAVYVAIVFLGFYYLTSYTPLRIFSLASFQAEFHPSFALPRYTTLPLFLRDLFTTFDIIVWPVLFISLPTLMMGATFPLISALSLRRNDREARTIGVVYFFNIIGNVLGGIAAGFLLLPYLGTELTVLLFCCIGFLFGLLSLGFLEKIPLFAQRRKAFVFALVVLCVSIFPQRGQLYAVMHHPPDGEWTTYVHEGQNGVVLAYESGSTVLNYINAQGHGGRGVPYAFAYYSRAIEALSFTPKPDDVFILGFGTGNVTEGVLKSDEVKSVTLVELNRALITNLTKMPLFVKILSDPRLKLHIEDGRRFLTQTDKKYDVIFMDPLRSKTAYSNNLYSREFFELLKDHLKPNGVVMIWFDEIHVLPNTILSVFDRVRMYNSFCLASSDAFMPKDEERAKRLRDTFLPIEQEQILKAARFIEDEDSARKRLAGFPINRDWKPITEYYLGLSRWTK